MSILSRLAKPRRRYAVRFADGTLREVRRTARGGWEVERPDAGAGLIVSYKALWRAKQALHAAGLQFVVLR